MSHSGVRVTQWCACHTVVCVSHSGVYVTQWCVCHTVVRSDPTLDCHHYISQPSIIPACMSCYSALISISYAHPKPSSWEGGTTDERNPRVPFGPSLWPRPGRSSVASFSPQTQRVRPAPCQGNNKMCSSSSCSLPGQHRTQLAPADDACLRASLAWACQPRAGMCSLAAPFSVCDMAISSL